MSNYRKTVTSGSEAWRHLLCGEIIDAKGLSEGERCYLRHRAWRVGMSLQSSGIGSYETLSLTSKAA